METNTQYLNSVESDIPSLAHEQKGPLPFINRNEQAKAKRLKKEAETKKLICQKIWNNPDTDLQDVFIKYPFCDELRLSSKELINLKGAKLIKSEHRIYYGQIVKTKKEGKGISIYLDGRVYEGGHSNNEKAGMGYQLYNNGNVYIGQFDRNKKHGKGVFYWLNLDENGIIEYYNGEWWDGLPSGTGKHQRCNGDLYQGSFKNGLKHGEGTEYFNNSDTYKGQYINGLPEGHGEYEWANKSNYKGEFRQGLRYGFGCWKKDGTDNCETYRGHYVLDLKSGHGIYSWPDGKFYKGEFFNDKKQGFGQLYNNEVLKYRGNWMDGKPCDDPPVQSGEETKRMRSQSGSSNQYHSTINNSNASFNQMKTTTRPANFRARTKSRQPTIESANSIIKETKLKRPSTVSPFDVRQLQNNTVYRVQAKGVNTKSEISNRCGFKCGHNNCIPTYPWDRRRSTAKQ